MSDVMRSSRWRAALLLLAFALLSPPAPAADRATVQSSGGLQKTWFELYDEAIAHIGRSEWPLAEQKLIAAKRDGPSPGRRALRFGSLRTPFFPDYYLGIVYARTNRSKEALDAFQLARSQNIDTNDSKFRDLDTLIRTTQETIARAGTPTDTKPTPTDPTPKPVEPAETPAVKPLPDPAKVLRQRFEDLLALAATQLAQRNYIGALGSAGDARKLEVDNDRADAMIQSIVRVRLIDQIRTDAASGDFTSAETNLKKLDPSDPEVPRLADAIRVARDAVEKLGKDAILRAAERNAMRQFYAGDYQRAIRILADVQKTQALSARASFYRACSLAALAFQSDPVDSSRLSEARAQYAQSLSGAAQFQSDRKFISPKILQALAGR